MAEQTMLDFIPFAGPRRVVAHLNPQPCFIRELLQCPAPKSSAWTVATSAIRCNQQAFSLGVTVLAHSLPPPSNGSHRKFSGIMANANRYPSFVAGNVIDAVRHRLALLLVWKIVGFDLAWPPLRPVRFAGILHISQVFFLFR